MRTQDFDFPRYEQAAAAQSRGISRDPISWSEILAAAQFAINESLDLPTNDVTNRLLGPNPLPLIAASRMLDASSLVAQPGREYDTLKDTLLLGAGAFALYGNFPSAGAVTRRLLDLGGALTDGEATALAIISPRQIGELMGRMTPGAADRTTLEQLSLFLRTADPDVPEKLRGALVEALPRARRSFETLLIGITSVVLEHIFHLSTAGTLSQPNIQLPEGYLTSLLEDRVSLLLPPQAAAINEDGFLNHDGNALITFPTSTGKTLLGELAMMSSIADGRGMAVYLAPYVALANQVFSTISRRSPAGITVQAHIGGYGPVIQLDPEDRAVVVVATPERFDTLLRNDPDLSAHIRCVIVDEAHLLGNEIRGLRLEGLVTRLRLLQASGAQFRIICLSAVVGDPQSITRWLGPENTLSITTTWRPTARRLAFWALDGQLLWLVGDDPVRRSSQTNTSIYASQPLAWPEPNLYTPRNYGDVRAQLGRVYKNIAYLVETLLNERRGSVLCVSATKSGTRGLAYRIADRLLDLDPVPDTVGRTIGLIGRKYPYLASLAGCLSRGVSYHNASLPHDIRQLIEQAARQRELRVVTATTTLAEGVDLPFYFTVLTDWLSWSADEQVLLDPLLFRNIAGRSGRAGYHTEGETIVFDNPVGDARFTGHQVRRQNQRSVFLLDTPPPLRSVAERPGFDTNPALVAALASQFMAAIPENPATNDLSQSFAETSYYAARGANIDDLLPAFRQLEGDLLDESMGALATAASPLHLTALGAAANRTGLSPRSCRAIVAELRSVGQNVDRNGAFAARLLTDLVGLPELGNERLRKKLTRVANTRYPIAVEDLEPVLESWINGGELEELFVDLGYVKRSTRPASINAWLTGNDPGSSWYDEFDKFVEFMTGAVCSFLPWVVRSAGQLEVFAGGPFPVDWALFADMLELGVNSAWAATALRLNAPASRRALAYLSRYWPADWPTDEEGFQLARRISGPQGIIGVFASAAVDLPPGAPLDEERLSVRDWLIRGW